MNHIWRFNRYASWLSTDICLYAAHLKWSQLFIQSIVALWHISNCYRFEMFGTFFQNQIHIYNILDFGNRTKINFWRYYDMKVVSFRILLKIVSKEYWLRFYRLFQFNLILTFDIWLVLKQMLVFCNVMQSCRTICSHVKPIVFVLSYFIFLILRIKMFL